MGHKKFKLNIIYNKIRSQGFAGIKIKMEAITTARTWLRGETTRKFKCQRNVRAVVLAAKKIN